MASIPAVPMSIANTKKLTRVDWSESVSSRDVESRNIAGFIVGHGTASVPTIKTSVADPKKATSVNLSDSESR
jgi:hypothetical protein